MTDEFEDRLDDLRATDLSKGVASARANPPVVISQSLEEVTDR